MTETHVLRVGHGTSRGMDTYGYPIVSLTDETTGKRVRCMGGGYDMLGTVLADWAETTVPDLLSTLAGRAYYVSTDGSYAQNTTATADTLYGVTAHRDKNGAVTHVTLDGACGVDSIMRALKVVGLAFTRTHDRRGNTTGYVVTVPATVSA